MFSFCSVLIGLALLSNGIADEIPIKLVQVGKEAILSCPMPKAGVLRLCLWNRIDGNGKTTFSISFFPNSNMPLVLNANYTYFGNIIHDCAITIKNVTEADISIWQCTTALKDNEAFSVNSFHLQNGVRPTKPDILEKSRLEVMVVGKNSTLSLTCCSENGVPTPVLEYYLGDRNVSETKRDDSQTPSRYCINWENANFNSTDHGLQFACIQRHPMFDTDEIDSEVVNVLYGPILVENKTANNLVLRANPKPDLTAFIQETNESLTDAMHFNINGNETLLNDIWNITWNISKGISENDTILIIATNPYGELNIQIAPAQKEKSGTLWSWISSIGWPTAAIVISLIVVTLCIVVTAISKWTTCLCFHSNSYDYDVRYTGSRNPPEHIVY